MMFVKKRKTKDEGNIGYNHIDEEMVKKDIGNEITFWSLVVIPILLYYFLFTYIWPSAYLTPDDGQIQWYLSGDCTGTPEPTCLYINVILSSVIAFFYKIMPNYQWWGIYNRLILFSSAMIVHYCFIKISVIKHIRIWKVLIALVVLDVVLIWYQLAYVSFTIVPAIVCAAFIATVFLLGASKSLIEQRNGVIIAGILYFLIIIQRRETAYVMTCYVLLVLLYHEVLKYGAKKHILKNWCKILLLLVVVLIINLIVQNSVNGNDVITFHKERARWIDYNSESYVDNPEGYEEAGWDKNIYKIAENWGFFPKEITTESFKIISTRNGDSLSRRLIMMVNMLKDGEVRAVLGIWVASLLWGITCVYTERKTCAIFILNFLGTFFLLLIQFIIGRLLYRTVAVVLIPAIIFNSLLTLNVEIKISSKTKIIAGCVTILALYNVAISTGEIFDIGKRDIIERNYVKEKEIVDYVSKNSENIFIIATDVYNDLNLMERYAGNHPTNIINWGSCSYDTFNYKKCIKNNGLNNLNSSVFVQDNVFFIAINEHESNLGKRESVPNALLDYLERENIAKNVLVVYEMRESNLAVYKYTF